MISTSSRCVALHPEGVDRNEHPKLRRYVAEMSPSTRRAWIEIVKDYKEYLSLEVALHPEGVDRNLKDLNCTYGTTVALHPEGVDRNTTAIPLYGERGAVALHLKGAGRTQIVTLDFWT